MTETMIIDSDNYQASGIETLFFPGGEPHAKCTESLGGDILFVLKARTWNDVGIGACVLDMLDRNSQVDRLDFFIPYYPGARQDRSTGLAPLTSFLVSKMFSEIPASVFDIHSDAAMKIIRSWTFQARNFMPTDLDINVRDNIVGVIAPDSGAVKRASLFKERFYSEADLVTCFKKRNAATGRLSGYHMPPLHRYGGYIIVDDICDGGGTFNLLAEAFFADPLGQESSLEMFVSHGIFSKGLDAIDPRISHITTTDSWCRLPESNRLSVLQLNQLYSKIQGAS